jgi:hypothetical protein
MKILFISFIVFITIQSQVQFNKNIDIIKI